MSVPNDVFGLTEIIKGFTFRERGGVKILKKWREEAVIMQLDIKIVSVSRTQYLNYGSLPPSGFYGFANLIMRDFSLPSIPIVQPRQTLYYAVNEFAQSAWMEFHQMVRLQENFKGIEQLVCFNTGLLLGACVPKECKAIPEPSFIEFPLREVFIKTHFGTQFEIELSYWKINAVLNNCGDLISPKSNQNDADKDGGLPDDGVSPNQALNPNDPYAGLPVADTSTKEGIIGQSKLDNLDNPDPDNAPLDTTLKYQATIYTEGYPRSCSIREKSFDRLGGVYTSPPSLVNVPVPHPNVCGNPATDNRISINGGAPIRAISAGNIALGVVVFSEAQPIPSDFFYSWKPI